MAENEDTMDSRPVEEVTKRCAEMNLASRGGAKTEDHSRRDTVIDSKSLGDLKGALETFCKLQSELKEYYNNTKEIYGRMRERLLLPADADNKVLRMSENDDKLVEQVVNKVPLILVVGQTNCGKSSIVNEIFQKSYLPTDENPCTSRLVRAKYSKTKYVRILDTHGRVLEERNCEDESTRKARAMLKEHIVLEGDRRKDEGIIQQYVEVGLDDPLLACGVEIVDAPGICENEALDKIVRECLDGILQVVLYVIDGERSVTIPDKNFLYKLRSNAPSMKIIFVCNKSEEREEAYKHDMGSDEEEDERVIHDKGSLALGKLIKASLLDELETKETFSSFHAVSCLKVRNARRRKWTELNDQDTFYIAKFQTLLSSLIGHFQKSVKRHLLNAASRLLANQTRALDFVIKENYLGVRHVNKLSPAIRAVLENEAKHFTEMMKKVDKEEAVIIKDIGRYLENSDERSKIIEDAGEYEFEPVCITDEIKRHYVLSACRRQIQAFVLTKVTKDIDAKLSTMQTSISDAVKTSLESCTRNITHIGPMSEFFREQLTALCTLTYEPLDPAAVAVDHGVIQSTLSRKASKGFENLKANFQGKSMLDKEWKQITAQGVLESINVNKLASSLCERIRGQLGDAHNEFTFAMNQITCQVEIQTKDIYKEQDHLAKFVPHFSRNLCFTEALKNTLEFGQVERGRCLGKGSRGEVYECRRMSHTTGCHSNEEVVAKIFNNQPNRNHAYYNYLRHLPKNQNFLRPLGIAFTTDYKLAYLLPKVDTNLFEELSGEATVLKTLTVYERLRIAVQISSACWHADQNGFRLQDIRPNNILVSHRPTGEPLIQINVLKWRDVSAPYPDGKPPFHFAPEIYKSGRDKQAKGYVYETKKHDAYAVAILTWMLAVGEFIRPEFAKGDDAAVESFVVNETAKITESLLGVVPDDHALKKTAPCMKLIEDILRRFTDVYEKRENLLAIHDTLRQFFRLP